MPLSSWVKATRWLHASWRDPVKRLALVAAFATAGCFGLLAGPPYFSTASAPQRWGDPVMEVETVRDTEDLRLTLGDAPSQDRETMRIKTKVDFAFIASYATFLIALGIVLARRGGWRRAAGVVLAIGAIAAGVFDTLENFAILDVLDVPIAATTETMLADIRRPSTIKWSLIGLCAILLVSFYEPSSRSEVSGPVRSDQS